MTAFAIKFERSSVTIASDTLAYVPRRGEARPLGFISKVIGLPQLRAVLFSRGQYEILVRVAAAAMLSPQTLGIEDLADALPAMLRIETDAYAEAHDIDDWRGVNLCEVVLAGWSEAGERMRMWCLNNYEDYTAQDDGGRFYGQLMTMPRLSDAQLRGIDKQPTIAALVAAMKVERQVFADNPDLMGGMILGGEILATEITPAGVSQRVVHRFEDFEATRHAAAAVAGRILRGDDVPAVADGLRRLDECSGLDDLPNASAPSTPPVITGTSRQQRRAAEKLARKAGRRAA